MSPANSPMLFQNASVHSTSRKPLAGQLPRVTPAEFLAHAEKQTQAAEAAAAGAANGGAGAPPPSASFSLSSLHHHHPTAHFWTPLAASKFNVRGKRFFSTGTEQPAYPLTPYVVVAVDVFRAPTKLTHVARLLQMPVANSALAAAGSAAAAAGMSSRDVAAMLSAWPQLLVINIQAPINLARQPPPSSSAPPPLPPPSSLPLGEGVSVVLHAQLNADFFINAPMHMMPLMQGIARGLVSDSSVGSVPFRERLKLVGRRGGGGVSGRADKGSKEDEKATKVEAAAILVIQEGEEEGEGADAVSGGNGKGAAAGPSSLVDKRGGEEAAAREDVATLLTHPCQMFFRGPDYLEIDIDLHRVPEGRRRPLLAVLQALADDEVDIAVVAQGNNITEVPEPVVACVRLSHIDSDLLTTLRCMP